MIDNAAVLIGAYAAMAAGLSVTVAKVSPTIGPKVRHFFSGTAPLVVVFGMLLGDADTVTLHGMDLLAGAGLAALGVATSSVTGKFLPTSSDKRKLLSR
ncbi:hypothetical protein [Qipengyuania mesophila]|uniref:hypothetical protein n=1 Tax=Qipengyuania mesophila TaxID=2867246 RepID=UPI0035118C1D